MNKILYLLPHPHFFKRYNYTGGHVSHFWGMIDGFKEFGLCVNALVADNPKGNEKHNLNLKLVKYGPSNIFFRQFWIIFYLFQLKRIAPYFGIPKFKTALLFQRIMGKPSKCLIK